MSPSQIKAALNWPKQGLSVYQDIVLAGKTVLRGRHDCQSRWDAIAPHLSSGGAILDVGSNFGWFGWKACQESSKRVVASLEADPHSARIQRRMLASHGHNRIVLLTARANAQALQAFIAAGQRFDAALCLSVLHWMPDHEAFLRRLSQIANKIIVELPEPAENGAGCEAIRREMGAPQDYLSRLFPPHALKLASLPSHRDSQLSRDIWLIDQTNGGAAAPSDPAQGLDAGALLNLSVSWPPRSWWTRELDQLVEKPDDSTLSFATHGLAWRPAAKEASSCSLRRLKRQLRRLPENDLLSLTQWCSRKARGVARRISRWRSARSISPQPLEAR